MRRHSKFFGIKLLNRFALITFLGCISLFSVGFSSWAFVKQTMMGEDVTISSSDIFYNSDYVEVGSISSSRICKFGFEGEDLETITKVNYVKVSLNIKKTIVQFANSKTIKLTAILRNDPSGVGFSFINDTYLTLSSLNLTNNSNGCFNISSLTPDVLIDNNTASSSIVISSFNFPESILEAEISFVYTFDLSSVSNFETDIYNNVKNNNLSFVFGAKVAIGD